MFGRVLRALLYVNDVSVKEIAEQADISVGYLNQLLANKKNCPSFEVFQRLAKAFNVSNAKLMEWCEYVEQADDSLYSQQILMVKMLTFYLEKKRLNTTVDNLEQTDRVAKTLKR